MTAHDGSRGGKAEPRASGVAAARLLEPDEGLEHPLQVDLRDAGSFVLDHDVQPRAVPSDARRRASVFGLRSSAAA